LVFNLPRLVSFYSYASGAQLYSRDEISTISSSVVTLITKIAFPICQRTFSMAQLRIYAMAQ